MPCAISCRAVRHGASPRAFLLGFVALALTLEAPAAFAGEYSSQLAASLAADPGHFNERMWALIKAHPEARDDIFRDAVMLTLQQAIAADPGAHEEIVARYKKMYPQFADQFEQPARTAGVVQIQQMELARDPSRTVTIKTPPRPLYGDSSSAYMRGSSWWGRNWGWVALGVGVAGTAGVVVAVAGSSKKSDDGPSGPQPFPAPPSVGAVQEYANQPALTTIHANEANARGYTGNGVKVAVIDSGVNTLHPDLFYNIASGGYDFINNTANVTDTDGTYYHGTHVAGVIAAGRNDYGIRGVAYDAKILPYAAIGDTAPATAVRDAVNSARAAGAKVINGSYAFGLQTAEAYETANFSYFSDSSLLDADAYLAAANAEVLMVFSAGNNYGGTTTHAALNPNGAGFLPFIRPANQAITGVENGAYRKRTGPSTFTTLTADYSGLEGHLLTVVSVDASNAISSFSNRCGVAKNWCFAAPGENITSASSGNSYSALSGTSFSAPLVSGAVAVLMQAYPELTNQQIIALLKNTAVDLGPVGVDDTYGLGLIDLAAATANTPPDPLDLMALGASMNGPTMMLSSAHLTMGTAFGDTAAAALAAAHVGMMDKYTRNYTASLAPHIAASSSAFDSAVAMRRFGQAEFRPLIALDDRNTVSFSMRAADGLQRAGAESDAPPSAGFESFSFTHDAGDGVAFGASHREPRAASLYFKDGDRELLGSQVTAGGVGNPYLDFVGNGYAQNVSLDFGAGALQALTAMGAPETSEGQRNMLAMLETRFGGDDAHIGFAGGALLEDRQALGMQGEGALALGQGTATWFGGMDASWQAAENTRLRASFYGGMTRAALAQDSLVRGAEDIMSTAWRAGIDQDGLLRDGDSLRVSLAQPLRAESGALKLDLPLYRLRDGSIVRQQADYALAPEGRELDLELGYRVPFAGGAKLDFAAMYRRDAGHVKGLNETIGLARLNRNF